MADTHFEHHIPAENNNQEIDTPEYRQQMIDKEEGKTTPSSDESKLLAGKYKTEEDLVKGLVELAKHKHGGDLEAAYKSLERGNVPPEKEGMDNEPSQDETEKRTQGTEDEAETKTPQEVTSEAQARDVLSQHGLNFDDFAVEFAEQGELSEESLAKIEAAGISRETVNQYADNLKTAAKAYADMVVQTGGGEEQYRAMMEWGAKNFSDPEKSIYDKMITSGDPDTVKFAVNSLKQRYEAANGTPPQRTIEGKRTVAPESLDVYNSWTEVTKDMRNPEYHTSETFRQKVATKLKRSPL